ncbi:hypothetical protein [Paraburkholderia sp.]|uniref:hypothetical protein n=1 Tax=Paraburkholderia sp. TaxID=1926495 RepID=UPI0039E3A679
MKKLVMKLLAGVAFVVASVIGGWFLALLPDVIPCGNIVDVFPCSNMPYPVDMFIRFCLSLTGHDDLANLDDMEILALLFYWALSTLIVAALLYAGVKTICRLYARKGL